MKLLIFRFLAAQHWSLRLSRPTRRTQQPEKKSSPSARSVIGSARTPRTSSARSLTGWSAGRPERIPDYNYSEANKTSGITWTEETLKIYLKNPQKMVPGTKMVFPGLSSETDIDNVIAYLKQFGPDGKKNLIATDVRSLRDRSWQAALRAGRWRPRRRRPSRFELGEIGGVAYAAGGIELAPFRDRSRSRRTGRRSGPLPLPTRARVMTIDMARPALRFVKNFFRALKRIAAKIERQHDALRAPCRAISAPSRCDSLPMTGAPRSSRMSASTASGNAAPLSIHISQKWESRADAAQRGEIVADRAEWRRDRRHKACETDTG